MNKTSIWTAIAMFIVCAASICYAAAVVNAVKEPPEEVRTARRELERDAA